MDYRIYLSINTQVLHTIVVHIPKHFERLPNDFLSRFEPMHTLEIKPTQIVIQLKEISFLFLIISRC